MAQQYQVDIVTKVVGASKIAQLDKALDQLARNEQKVDTAARKAASSTNTLGSSAQAAGSKAKASAAGFKSMGAAINAAAAKITIIIGAVQTFSQVMGAAFERQNAEKRLQNLTGSTAEYEAALLSAAAVSQKFGISQTEATQALGDVYSRLSGVGFGLKQVTTIYEGFNTVARESGISSEAASSAFLQLGQALGSGVLQGDEMRSILEQMPQLTQMIAAEMGIAASQVKKFGSEGKVTSDIIYSALEKAALGATDLNGKLTPAQQSMNNFNVAIDKASVALGTALIPALTGLIEAITPVISAVGTLVQKLDQLGASKVFEFLMAPARAFGDLVNGAAGETENLSQAAKEAVNDFSSLPEVAAAAQEPIEATAGSAKKIAQNTEEAKGQVVAMKGRAIDLVNATRTQAEIDKEIASIKELQANAQRETNQATGQGVQKTAELGESNLRAAGGAKQIAEEMMTTNSMIQQATGSANQLAGALQGAASAASSVGSAMGGSRMVNGGSSSHVTIGQYKAVDGKMVKKSEQEIQQEYLSSALSGNGGAKIVYDNSRMDARFGAQLYYANQSGLAMWDTPQGGVIDPRRIANTSSRPYYMSERSAQLAMGNPFVGAYADGGYVTGPQQAIVGEGGEPEYIIPASKMSQAMSRYSSGMRGDSVIPKSATVNVNYSGSTVNMGGSDYISKGDVPGLLSSAVNQTLTTLRKSPRARLESGLR